MDSLALQHTKPTYGFTLIELLMVLLIISILLAYPLLGVKQHMNRAHRLDGQMALLDLANRMERYHAQHHTYQQASIGTGHVSDVLSTSRSPEGWYTLQIIRATDTTYLLQAKLSSEHPQTNTACTTLTFSSEGE